MLMHDLFEAGPNDWLRAQKLYHGTRTSSAARSIILNGLMPGADTIYRHQLRPAEGMVYLTPDLQQAVKYAIGDGRNRSASEYADPYFYVFVFAGDQLTDIVPDEDSIGDFLWMHTRENEAGGRGKSAWRFTDDHLVGDDTDSKRAVWEFLYHHATVRELRGCCTLGRNRPYAWAAFGKRMQHLLPEWMTLKLIEWGAHVAQRGVLKPQEAWRCHRQYQQELWNTRAFRFFELAERVYQSPLKESADMVRITPELIAAVRKAGNHIAADIAENWPQDDNELAMKIRRLLGTMHAIGGIGQTMTVDRVEMRPKQMVRRRIKSVGCHWSWGDGASIYHSDNAEEEAERGGYSTKDLIEIRLVATVAFDDIDWPYTIATNFIHPSEEEITIKNGATVMLDDIWVGDKEINVGRPVGVSGSYDYY